MSEPGLPAWIRPLASAVGSSAPADYLLRAPVAPAAGGRRSAVLILLGEGPAGPDILLIQRAERLRKHAGQPAFPGGAMDPDDDGPVGTALRESAEEVGLDPAGVRVVALLPELYLPPTGFLVTPVLAWWHRPAPVRVVDPGEVALVERVPVAELVDPANRCRVRGPSGYAGPAFTVRGMTVWGFTAAVLDRLLEQAGWARPWDPDDVRDLPRRAHDLAVRGVAPGIRPPLLLPDGTVPAGTVPAGTVPAGTVPRAAADPAAADPAGSVPPAAADPDDGPAAEGVLPAGARAAGPAVPAGGRAAGPAVPAAERAAGPVQGVVPPDGRGAGPAVAGVPPTGERGAGPVEGVVGADGMGAGPAVDQAAAHPGTVAP